MSIKRVLNLLRTEIPKCSINRSILGWNCGMNGHSFQTSSIGCLPSMDASWLTIAIISNLS